MEVSAKRNAWEYGGERVMSGEFRKNTGTAAVTIKKNRIDF